MNYEHNKLRKCGFVGTNGLEIALYQFHFNCKINVLIISLFSITSSPGC